MTPEKFVSDIREQIVIRGTDNYKNMLTLTDKSPDPGWQQALFIYKRLPKEHQVGFLAFIRTIIVDSVSHLLGIIDGTSYLNKERDEVMLIDQSTKEKLSDFLQDIFLEMEEENEQ